MSEVQLWHYAAYSSPLVLLIGIFVGLSCFWRLNPGIRLVFYYLVICLLTDLLCRYFGHVSHLKNNMFLLPIFAFFELLVFSILYYKQIFRSKGKLLLLFIVLMHLIVIWDVSTLSRLLHRESIFSFGKVIADISILSFCMIYYWKLSKGQIASNSEYFRLNAAIFIYYSINLIIYLSLNFLVNNRLSIVTFFWAVNLVSVVSFYLFLTYLIWQNGKTRKVLQ
jgi:hypothetical protein